MGRINNTTLVEAPGFESVPPMQRSTARNRGGPKSPTERVVYTASPQENFGSIVTVRSEGSQSALMSSYQSVLREADPNLPVHGMSPVSAQIDEALSPERLLAILGLAFGGLALLLVVIGLYGLLASVVVRRTNEIGVRIALGASQKSVLWMVLRQRLVMVGAGMAAGMAADVFLTRFVSSQLYGVNPERSGDLRRSRYSYTRCDPGCSCPRAARGAS